MVFDWSRPDYFKQLANARRRVKTRVEKRAWMQRRRLESKLGRPVTIDAHREDVARLRAQGLAFDSVSTAGVGNE